MIAEQVIFRRFRGGRILLDTNLLLLLLIGSFERDRIENFKRTAKFSKFDFDQLAGLLRAFTKIVTTPHILTEVSNLANALPDYLKRDWSRHFAERTRAFLEVFRGSKALMQGPVFLAFGLADAAIHALASETLILTEDYRLSGFLRSRGLPVLNFRDFVALSRIQYP
jgi:rRNA-processing protein FCF1